MSFFPIFIDLYNKHILIVGGGKVALRKLKVILKFTKNVTVVAPNILKEIKSLGVHLYEREFNFNDISNKFLVIVATDNKMLNQEVLETCASIGILCNSATSTNKDNCIFPSILKYGDITIGVSTNGKNPHISKKIRENIEQNISLEEYNSLINR